VRCVHAQKQRIVVSVLHPATHAQEWRDFGTSTRSQVKAVIRGVVNLVPEQVRGRAGAL